MRPSFEECGERRPIPEGPYDLAVVGGGINGAAICRDAALRGKTVVLLEKGDFGQGASSRTSKMIHGGLRYLEDFRFGLVHESLRERAFLLRLAPHLVRPQEFLVPVCRGSRWGPKMTRLGLHLYDWLALGRRVGRSGFLDGPRSVERLGTIRPEGLLGCGSYFDAVMDDSRLVLANVIAAQEEARGGRGDPSQVVVRNYAEVVSVKPGSPSTLLVLDRVSGSQSRVLAHRVAKALGPWTEPGLLVPSRGVHLVLPGSLLAADGMPEAGLLPQVGLLLTHSRDGRVFFMIPWMDRTIVGTTETPFVGSPDGLRVEPDEVSYLIDEVKRVLPAANISRRDILGAFVGIRPLARVRFASGGSLGSVSRSHRIRDEGSGILSVFGGKYTTYRHVARQVVDRLFPESYSTTDRKPLPGGERGEWARARGGLTDEIARFGEGEVRRLFSRYGTRLCEVLALVVEDPSLGERIDGECDELRAEVVHAVQREFAVYPVDFLARRATLRWSRGGGRTAYDAVESIIRSHARVVPPDLARAREEYFGALEWEDGLREGEPPAGGAVAKAASAAGSGQGGTGPDRAVAKQVAQD